MKKFIKANLHIFTWIVALVAMLGSLYFSEIRHFTPCILCWYQRIAMYPLVLITSVGIIRNDKNLPYYVLPSSVIGGLIAFYHTLLQAKIIPEALAPCRIGVSCVTKQFELFHFVTIPMMSLIAFILITIAMILSLRWNKTAEQK